MVAAVDITALGVVGDEDTEVQAKERLAACREDEAFTGKVALTFDKPTSYHNFVGVDAVIVTTEVHSKRSPLFLPALLSSNVKWWFGVHVTPAEVEACGEDLASRWEHIKITECLFEPKRKTHWGVFLWIRKAETDRPVSSLTDARIQRMLESARSTLPCGGPIVTPGCDAVVLPTYSYTIGCGFRQTDGTIIRNKDLLYHRGHLRWSYRGCYSDGQQQFMIVVDRIGVWSNIDSTLTVCPFSPGAAEVFLPGEAWKDVSKRSSIQAFLPFNVKRRSTRIATAEATLSQHNTIHVHVHKVNFSLLPLSLLPRRRSPSLHLRRRQRKHTLPAQHDTCTQS
jgi:hypothetical protein